MANQNPIRSAGYVVNQILEGVKLCDLQSRIEISERPLHWSLFVLGAMMVADRLAAPAVRTELEAFEKLIGEKMERRSDVAYASMLSDDCEVTA